MKFWISPLVAALALGATAASAEPFQGFHAGVGIGGSKVQSEDKIPGFARKADNDAKGFARAGERIGADGGEPVGHLDGGRAVVSDIGGGERRLAHVPAA